MTSFVIIAVLLVWQNWRVTFCKLAYLAGQFWLMISAITRLDADFVQLNGL